MALLRRAPELEQSAQHAQRPRVIHMLRGGLRAGVPTAAGWLCLAELCRKDGNPQEALSAARQARPRARRCLHSCKHAEDACPLLHLEDMHMRSASDAVHPIRTRLARRASNGLECITS